MKLDYLKEKRELISVVLLGVSAFFAVCILVEVTGFFVASARAEKLVKGALVQSKPDPNDTEKYFTKSKEIVDELKKKNLFAPPPPKKHPVSQVPAIFGDEALINGKWYKVGDKVGDAKIVAIESTCVRIEWEGKEKVFYPFDVKSAPERKEKKTVVEKARGKRKGARVRKPKEEKVSAASEEEDPLAWMGVKLSPALRAKFLERWNKMSDEEKEKVKEQWSKMSDEQKQQTVDSMEENIDQM